MGERLSFRTTFNSHLGCKNLSETVCDRKSNRNEDSEEQGRKRMINNCRRWLLLSEIVTVGRSSRRNGEELHWVLRFSPSVYWYMSSSCLVWRRLLLYAVRRSGGASTQSAFLYAAMTVLSRAVSPHQQPSILIAQPKSKSKLGPPHPHHNQSNQRKQWAKKTRGPTITK